MPVMQLTPVPRYMSRQSVGPVRWGSHRMIVDSILYHRRQLFPLKIQQNLVLLKRIVLEFLNPHKWSSLATTSEKGPNPRLRQIGPLQGSCLARNGVSGYLNSPQLVDYCEHTLPKPQHVLYLIRRREEEGCNKMMMFIWTFAHHLCYNATLPLYNGICSAG